MFEDKRGFFLESYNKTRWKENGIDIEFIQDNHSLSRSPGVIRGMHFQKEPFAQTKLVRVLAGGIYDVVVDLRKSSKTFGKWFGVYLNAENHKWLLIPKGFAHGFCTIAPNTQVIYKVDQLYSKDHEEGIIWNDSNLNINWPIKNPVLSEKDTLLPEFCRLDYHF